MRHTPHHDSGPTIGNNVVSGVALLPPRVRTQSRAELKEAIYLPLQMPLRHFMNSLQERYSPEAAHYKEEDFNVIPFTPEQKQAYTIWYGVMHDYLAFGSDMCKIAQSSQPLQPLLGGIGMWLSGLHKRIGTIDPADLDPVHGEQLIKEVQAAILTSSCVVANAEEALFRNPDHFTDAPAHADMIGNPRGRC